MPQRGTRAHQAVAGVDRDAKGRRFVKPSEHPLFWRDCLIFRLRLWWNSKASVAAAARAGRRILKRAPGLGQGVHFANMLDRIEGKKPWP